MKINDTWEKDGNIYNSSNSYHNQDFLANDNKHSNDFTKTLKELCSTGKQDIRDLDKSNIAGLYASKSNDKLNPIFNSTEFVFYKEDGNCYLSSDRNYKDDYIPFRFCTLNGNKEKKYRLEQPYCCVQLENSEYFDYLADDLVRFLLKFPIKRFLNTVYVSVKKIVDRQNDNLQYGFFEIPGEFYENEKGVCTLSNYLKILESKNEDDRKKYVIDNWWFISNYYNEESKIENYFYNIFVQQRTNNAIISRTIVNNPVLDNIKSEIKTVGQDLYLYSYYYNNFYFLDEELNFFHNYSWGIYNENSSIKKAKEKPYMRYYSKPQNEDGTNTDKMMRIRRKDDAHYQTAADLGIFSNFQLNNLQEGSGQIVNKLFIGRYDNSNKIIEKYSNGDELRAKNSLYVIFKVWSVEEIESFMDNMICCWTAKELSDEEKNNFFNGIVSNNIKIPVIEENCVVYGTHNIGQNAYNNLLNSMLDFVYKSKIDPSSGIVPAYNIEEILPSPNFSKEKNLIIPAASSYDDYLDYVRNVSLWGIKEKENGKYSFVETFPYSSSKNNQSPYVGMIRTKVAAPTIIRNEDGELEISNFKFQFEDVVKKAKGETSENYTLQEIIVHSFDTTPEQESIVVEGIKSLRYDGVNNEFTPYDADLNSGFYRGEIISWSQENFDKITFSIKVNCNIIEYPAQEVQFVFKEDKEGGVIISGIFSQGNNSLNFTLPAYDKNKEKRVYKLLMIKPNEEEFKPYGWAYDEQMNFGNNKTFNISDDKTIIKIKVGVIVE